MTNPGAQRADRSNLGVSIGCGEYVERSGTIAQTVVREEAHTRACLPRRRLQAAIPLDLKCAVEHLDRWLRGFIGHTPANAHMAGLTDAPSDSALRLA